MTKKTAKQNITNQSSEYSLDTSLNDASGSVVREANLSQEENEPEIAVFRPDRQGIRKVLGDLEADIMEFMWDHPASLEANAANDPIAQGVTVREVYEAFRLKRVIAYTTVMSTMNRLAHKHLLNSRKAKNETAYFYTPSLSKEAFVDNFVGRILENLLVSFSNSTESHLQRLATEESAIRLDALKNRLDTLRSSNNLPKASNQPDEIRNESGDS